MNDYLIYALCVAVPLLLVFTGFRDRVAPLIDRVFETFDIPYGRRGTHRD